MTKKMEKEFTGDLILLRGLPGSGKTTLAHIILQHPAGLEQEVLSADDFFENEDGDYNFDSTKIKEAHNYCQFRCSERMRQEKSRIVVANTFTQEWEMEDYLKMAERYNYRVHTIIVENRHGNQNVHGVPEDKLQQMKNRFEIKL
jgi:predicted kinase